MKKLKPIISNYHKLVLIFFISIFIVTFEINKSIPTGAYHLPFSREYINFTNITIVPTNLNVPVRNRLEPQTYNGWFTAFRVVAAPRMYFRIPATPLTPTENVDTVYLVVKNLSSRIPPGSIVYYKDGWKLVGTCCSFIYPDWATGAYVYRMYLPPLYYRAGAPPTARKYTEIIIRMYGGLTPYPVNATFQLWEVTFGERRANGKTTYEPDPTGFFTIQWNETSRLPFRFVGVNFTNEGVGRSYKKTVYPGFVAPSGSILLKNLSYFVQIQYAFDSRMENATNVEVIRVP